VKRLAVLPLLVIVAALAAAPASAATPCWKKVVNDWLKDGRIDAIYDDVCYEQALDNLPTDLEEYSSLGDDIELAREAATRGELPEFQQGKGVPPVVGGGGDDGGGSDDGALPNLLRTIGPRNAEDVPIPLLVLGAIATLLMASGAAGMVARRTAHRRLPPSAP
jgi:hypothetical protein